jgi:hypothetical protein
MLGFYGVYDTKPHDDMPDVYDFQRDYAFLRDDGLLVISAKGTHTDGASVPRWAWCIVGHPMHGMNKYWSAAHDSLYAKTAIILDTHTLGSISVDSAFHIWRSLPARHFIHQTAFDKKFADQTLKQAMKALGESRVKTALCYSAVRVGGKGWW